MRNAYYQLMNYIDMAQVQDVFYYAAKTILENLSQIPELSITQVAEMCYASTSTISRLIRRLNYSSYNDFKQDVMDTLREISGGEPLHFAHELMPESVQGSLKHLKDSFFEAIQENLQFTSEMISARDIMEIVRLIDEAQEVIFLGFNFSQMISAQLRSTLAAYGRSSLAKTSEKLQLESLREAKKNDLIILTSITGNYFRFKPEAALLFKNSPATKVAITQNKELAEAFHADKIFVVGKDNLSYIGKFSVMMIYEMIEMFYMMKHRQDMESIDE